MPALRLLLIFATVFSLASLPSVLSSSFYLPSIPIVRAQQETTYGSWYPAGAQMRTLTISEGDGTTGTQVGWLLTNQVDAEDWPLTASQIGGGSGNVNCPGSTTIVCSAPVADQGYFEIEFNLANVLWGIPMNYGNSAAGVQLRQGIAHLINKAAFVSANSACAGVVCVPNDDPLPPCSVSSCPNGGLVNPNPCGWDTIFPESSSSNCIVGAPGGTAYNCAYSTACPAGTVTGLTQFPWQAAIGSPDFCAAAQHFVQAFTDAGITGVTTNANCELVPPGSSWPSVVTAINTLRCAGIFTADSNTCMAVRTTEPRKSLGEGIAQDICALFSPAFGSWTTLSGHAFSCAPFLQEVESREITNCAFSTSTDGTPTNCWGMFTAGFGQVFPFDSTTYFEYNSLFSTKTDYTCVSGDCSSKVPGSPCASTTYTDFADDYMYLCSPTYDSLSQAMEFSTCLASPGPSTDPTFNQVSPTFANCSGESVSGGAGATTCIGASPICSAVSAGYQALDFFGKNVFTLPIWTGNDYYARLSNWSQGGSAPGFGTAVGFGFYGLPNYFNWLNAYSATPAVPGTFRQGFLTTVNSLNPFDAATLWDFHLLENIYDSLFQPNPLCSISTEPGVTTCSQPLQLMDWMTTSHAFLCYPGGSPCTSTTLGYGNSTYFAGTTADLRLTLNRSNHWQDGGPVTAWDVKYSFINLNATGAYQATSLSNVAHINVLDEYTLDLNLKAKGPFTDYSIGSITIIPGHVWSACGASTWNNGVTGKNLAGSSIVNATEDTCVGHFGSPSIATVGGVRADSPTFDPLANLFVIGSGPFTCQSIGGAGQPPVGMLGGNCGCSAPGFCPLPPGALSDFTLTRAGCTLTSTGTTCGVAGSGSDYFRSSGALAKYIWSGDIGSGSADFSKVLTVNSCHSSSPSANCPHWAQGIGNPGGAGNNAVGLSQRLAVNSYKGVSWIAFSTPQSSGTQSILSCVAGYTLPGTTITPCNTSNARWTDTVLPGIGAYASILYEVGSAVLGADTSTLAPASIVGCAAPVGTAAAYPNGGYDC